MLWRVKGDLRSAGPPQTGDCTLPGRKSSARRAAYELITYNRQILFLSRHELSFLGLSHARLTALPRVLYLWEERARRSTWAVGAAFYVMSDLTQRIIIRVLWQKVSKSGVRFLFRSRVLGQIYLPTA